MIDVVVQAESAIGEADVAGVMPVCDVDVVAASSVRTVLRKRVAKWPESGATTSMRGCGSQYPF